MKTLAQIEPRAPISSLPFTISTPGSYYLTTNLTGAAGVHGIIIDAQDVTLDLGGFALNGLTNSLNGIMVSAARDNLVIHSGTVSGWAVGLDARAGNHCRFEHLRLVQNRIQGLAAGVASHVRSCDSYLNRGNGISADQSSMVMDSSARSNLLHGIVVEAGSRVTGCMVSANSADGLVVGDNSSVAECIAHNNLGSGIGAGADAQVSASKVSGSGVHGISAGMNAVVNGCSVSGNRDTGIVTAAGGQVHDCRASANTRGIVVQSGSTVRKCTALQNNGDGISVTSECVVVANHSAGNFLARDAAGIRATGSGNSIQENTVISNDWGIRLDAARNILIKNSASNNSLNYSIGTTPQSMGPIISGDRFLENSNPTVNFEF